jgi:beta-glucosidase
MLPNLGPQVKTAEGKPGVVFKAFTSPASDSARKPVATIEIADMNMYLSDFTHPALTEDLWWAEVEAYFTPEESCEFEFGLTVHGTAKLWFDDELLVDNETKQRAGGSFFNVGTVEETGTQFVEKGKTYKLLVKWASGVTSKLAEADGVVSFGGGGLRIGGARVIDVKEEIKKAVELAKRVDQVVLCVGLNSDWEQEGHDRPHMDLPEHTDELVAAVAAANPKTVVVVQSGTPVTMLWEKDVAGLVHAWYGGNETGNAIADVLYGDVNPSGKLSLSFPKQVEDNPAYLSYRSERGRVLYGEDVYVGYRFYEATKKAALYPFGWGLSYASFKFSGLKVAADEKSKILTVTVDVENTGSVDGAEVIQVYVSQQSPSLRRPEKELKGFKKVLVEKGSSKTVEVVIETKYATSFWDEERDQWIEESGTYDVLVGNSSANVPLKVSFEVAETSWWSGL